MSHDSKTRVSWPTKNISVPLNQFQEIKASAMSTLRFQDDSGYQDSTPYACVPASHDYQLPKTSDSLQNLQLQKIVDDLHATVQKFERLAFGPDCPKPMSILGKFSCQQSGCFFRCKDYDDFSRHINQGFHCKFKIYRFGDQDLRRTSDSHHPTAEASSTSRFDFQGEKRARKEDPLEINTQFSVTVQNPSECSTLPNDCNDVIHAVEGMLNQFIIYPSPMLTKKTFNMSRRQIKTFWLFLGPINPASRNTQHAGNALI